MSDRFLPPGPGPEDDDLPDVFSGLTGIDVIDGELVPRVAEPPAG